VISRGPDSGFRHLAADLVIGADGLRSSVAALAGAPVLHEARNATGVVFGYFAGLPADRYHWHFRPGVSAGVIPTNGGLTCVFVSLPAARLRNEMAHGVEALFRRGLAAAAPAVAQAVTAAPRAGTLRIFPGTPGFVRRPYGPGWALVGDAGYFRDPLTAHGITDALRDAELLADAVRGGSGAVALAAYEAERSALSLGLFEVTDEIAGFGWDLPRLRELHDRLSDEMSRGVRALAARGSVAQAA
jgi:2-polyprenyl-6-methoxyphenol hydroxylase-like FAD-dependent oxidoreductase